MSWASAGSAIFQQAMLNPITRVVNGGSANTGQVSLTADTVKVAVFNNTTAPDKTVATVTLTAYNGGSSQWVTANEITGTGWSAGGVAIGTTSWTVDSGSSSLCFTVSGGQTSTTGVTLAGFYGALVYDSTPSGTANPGVCFNYFGGTQTITAGTFTILWATPASAAVTAVFNISV